MCSWEIADYINKRNGVLVKDEVKEVNNIYKNPQLVHIIYHPFNSSFEMWDDEGIFFSFKILLN